MTVSRSPVGFPRISARVRILLWLLVVMAVALGAVAVTVRSILQRDVDHRISKLLTQETGEFANFVPQGVDPDTGGRFETADRLLRIYLQRQYADPDEELLGLTGPAGKEPGVIRQRRDLPRDIALWKDKDSLTRIRDSLVTPSARCNARRANCAGRRSRSGRRRAGSPGRSSSPSTRSANEPSPTRPSGCCSACPGSPC